MKHGFRIAQRIAMVYRTAVYLGKEYVDVLQTKDSSILLQSAVDDYCANRLLVISDIMLSVRMTSAEIATFMAMQIVRPIIKSRFYLLHGTLSPIGHNLLWNLDLDTDFHLFLNMCPNTSLLGYKLLKYCDALKIYRQLEPVQSAPSQREFAGTAAEPDIQRDRCNEISDILDNLRMVMENQVLSHKKQNIITVELLIKAHDCFLHECSMEGIACVLQYCKLLNSALASAKSWRLIVRLLIGIGRFRDMYYCFETLIRNEQFESLLGQFDEERLIGLKEAIISYLHEHYPDDTDNYHLTALHFQMYHELAQINEKEAGRLLDTELKRSEVQLKEDMAENPMGFKKPSSTIEPDSATFRFNGNFSTAALLGVSFIRCNKILLDSLTLVMESYAHAAENHLLDSKLGLAQRSAAAAELIAMQIHLVRDALETSHAHCICVLNIKSEQVFRFLINSELK